MGKCLEALGSQPDTLGSHGVRCPFQLLLGLEETTKIIIGVFRQGDLPSWARRGDVLFSDRAVSPHIPCFTGI